jgi:hypothetical protein
LLGIIGKNDARHLKKNRIAALASVSFFKVPHIILCPISMPLNTLKKI